MRVRFTPSARTESLAAIDRIRRANRSAALRFRQRDEASLRRLERFPDSGASVQDFPDLPYREVFASPDRFFYRVEGEPAWFVEGWHGAQIPDEPDHE